MELFNLAHTCCFTGHRPEKLGIYEGVARAWLEDRIDEAVTDGYTTFITGCAKGADLWAGDIVLNTCIVTASVTAIMMIASMILLLFSLICSSIITAIHIFTQKGDCFGVGLLYLCTAKREK